MRRLAAELERVGPTSASVLIRGETGTGKEMVARRLHPAPPARPASTARTCRRSCASWGSTRAGSGEPERRRI
jgi:transcriptional regulator with GAF, ATPase, and Fis domain